MIAATDRQVSMANRVLVIVALTLLAAGCAGQPPHLAPAPADLALDAEARQLDAESAQLERRMAALIERRRQLAALGGDQLANIRAGGPGDAPTPSPSPPAAPVGAPPATPQETQVNVAAAVPAEIGGVLLPAGRLVLEPSLEYTHSSTNVLVFQGVEVIPGVQIGLLEASSADRNAASGGMALRYGLDGRTELRVAVPYTWRQDRVTTVQQRDQSISQDIITHGESLGDMEFAVHRQLNSGADGWPVLVAFLQATAPTGIGPYDITRDSNGIARQVTTGAGYWTVQPGLTIVKVSDPAVLFGNLSYAVALPYDANRTYGSIQVGKIFPGDAIGASMGMGLSVNPDFSFSLAFKYNFLFGTDTILNGTTQHANSLHVGVLALGMTYQVSSTVAANINFEFGVTRDAPDVHVILRLPISMQLF